MKNYVQVKTQLPALSGSMALVQTDISRHGRDRPSRPRKVLQVHIAGHGRDVNARLQLASDLDVARHGAHAEYIRDGAGVHLAGPSG